MTNQLVAIIMRIWPALAGAIADAINRKREDEVRAIFEQLVLEPSPPAAIANR
jgi:hypothetical protein